MLSGPPELRSGPRKGCPYRKMSTTTASGIMSLTW
jgi:hypothetical protein